VAKHLDAGYAAFVAGKTAEEAFAPWKGSVAEPGLDSIRPPMKEAGAVAAKSFYLECELHFLREKARVYRVRLGLWATPERVTIATATAEATEGDGPDGAFPVDTTSPTLRPFAQAAKGLDAALRGDGWKTVPFADKASLREALLPLVGEKGIADAEEEMDAGRKAWERAAAEVKAAEPDAVVVRLDDQGSVAVDAAGKVVGMIAGELDVEDDGSLSYQVQKYRVPTKRD
jgi:hypothetical protein